MIRSFFVNLGQKADWEHPKNKGKVKITKYFLKTGEVVSVKREKISKNYLWKYYKPLKYYFLAYKQKCLTLKEKDLEKISKKWQIEELKEEPINISS